jgi:hypothetical protein
MIQEGEYVRLAWEKNKRVMGVVKEVMTGWLETTVTIRPGYKTSPKSQLKLKNPFIKNKYKLIP